MPDLKTIIEKSFGVSSLHVAMPPAVLWGGFGVVLFIYLVMSATFLYHWGTYSYHPVKVKVVGGIYFIGSFVLIAVMLISIFGYLASLS